MGLDMDFYKINADGEKESIAYFRKHADLNGLLQECWIEKNPDKSYDDFNCCEFEITLDEVKRVEDYMKQDISERVHYCGFFWGTSTEQDWEETVCVFTQIKNLLEDGQKVVYAPWW